MVDQIGEAVEPQQRDLTTDAQVRSHELYRLAMLFGLGPTRTEPGLRKVG